MENKETSFDFFVRTEKQYVEEDTELINIIKNSLSTLEKHLKVSPKPNSNRIKNFIDAAEDLIQYEEGKLECRIRHLQNYINNGGFSHKK